MEKSQNAIISISYITTITITSTNTTIIWWQLYKTTGVSWHLIRITQFQQSFTGCMPLLMASNTLGLGEVARILCTISVSSDGRFHQMWAWWPNFSSMIFVQTNCINQKSHTSLISCPNIIQNTDWLLRNRLLFQHTYFSQKYAVKIQD